MRVYFRKGVGTFLRDPKLQPTPPAPGIVNQLPQSSPSGMTLPKPSRLNRLRTRLDCAAQQWLGKLQMRSRSENNRSRNYSFLSRLPPSIWDTFGGSRWWLWLCLHDQNKGGFFGGPAFIQPIRAI